MFSTLVEGIGYFLLQIRILHAKILPGDTSRRLETDLEQFGFLLIFGGQFDRKIDGKLSEKQSKTPP